MIDQFVKFELDVKCELVMGDMSFPLFINYTIKNMGCWNFSSMCALMITPKVEFNKLIVILR